jgi:hypothetical protein
MTYLVSYHTTLLGDYPSGPPNQITCSQSYQSTPSMFSTFSCNFVSFSQFLASYNVILTLLLFLQALVQNRIYS